MGGERYSDSDKSKVVQAYKEGATLDEAAALVGTTRASVVNWVKKTGGEVRDWSQASVIKNEKGRGLSLGREVWDAIEKRYKEGLGSIVIAREFEISHRAVLAIVARKGLTRSKLEAAQLAARRVSQAKRKYALNEDIFDDLNADTAWVLGVIYGDGSIIRYRGILNGLEIAGDRDVCCKVRDILESEHPVRKKGGCYIVRFSSRKLANALARHGVIPNKSNHLSWPSTVSKELESHFLRGLFDADGYVTLDKKRSICSIGIGLSSEDLIRSIQQMMLGIILFEPSVSKTVYKNVNHADRWSIRLYGRNAINFSDWLWKDSELHSRGNRKYKKFLEAKEFLLS